MSKPSEPSTTPEPGKERAAIRKVAAGLLLVEASVLAILSVYSLVIVAGAQASPIAIPLALFFAIFALALVWTVHSLWNFGRFGVSFGVTWQLFQALVGASLLRTGLIPAGFFAIGMALILFFMLVRPENRPMRELFIEDD